MFLQSSKTIQLILISNPEHYSADSIKFKGYLKLQGRSYLSNINRNSSLAYFAISKLTNYILMVYINGYSIIKNDRNRNGGGVACYIRNNLCFNSKNIFFKFYWTCFFSKFSSQKLNLTQLQYFTELQMYMTF